MAATTTSESPIRVCIAGMDPAPVSFAAEELVKYLRRATNREVVLGKSTASPGSCGLTVGLMEAIPGVSAEVPDSRMDDAIFIDVTGDHGVIAGNNPRSVLLGVYRYLTEFGVRWVRPGADGEVIPESGVLPEVKVQERPSYRHRAVCIEGAVSLEHVCDMVDWLPKLGFNGYFVQFREAHTFFDRWYAHINHPTQAGERLSIERAREYTAKLESEIARRGLLYHKVGHGWTCEPFGISGLGWEQEAQEPSPEVKQYLAEVNGERGLWHGVALNTNLCYSNLVVREKIVEAIATYAKGHPEVDLLHFWLADGTNNHCECPGCRGIRPSDLYVRMLNELDAVLTGKGLKTRIVFLIYVDLLWPPEEERIANPDRFVLMFAPIERTYSEAFRIGGTVPELPPYERNKLQFSSNVDENVAFLKAWQAGFAGDSFDFDYHLMWDHVNDPGHIHISKTISEDMKALKEIGLDGYVSCQIQRIFFPTALAMTVMGRTLWNRDLSYEEMERDYFESAFGSDGMACRDHLALLSELFDPPFVRQERPGTPENVRRLEEVQSAIRAFLPVIERNRTGQDPCRAQSWEYLRHHAELTSCLARALKAKAEGARERAASLWEEVKALAWEKEPEIHRVFDAFLFAGTMVRKFPSDRG